MENTQRTWSYLKELNAVLIETKVIVQKEFIGDTISVHKREYYRKRNGKTCYVDFKKVQFKTEWDKIKANKYSNVFSTGDSDWRPLRTTNVKYKFLGNYKQELIDRFLKDQPCNSL